LILPAAHFSSILTGRNKEVSLKEYLSLFLALKEDTAEKQYYCFFDVTLWLKQHLSKVK